MALIALPTFLTVIGLTLAALATFIVLVTGALLVTGAGTMSAALSTGASQPVVAPDFV